MQLARLEIMNELHHHLVHVWKTLLNYGTEWHILRLNMKISVTLEDL